MSETSSLTVSYDALSNSSFQRDTSGLGEYVKKTTSYSLDYTSELSETSKLAIGYASYDAPDRVDNNSNGTTYDQDEAYAGDSVYLAYSMAMGSINITPFYMAINHKENYLGTVTKGNHSAYGVTFSGGIGNINMGTQTRDHWIGLLNSQFMH